MPFKKPIESRFKVLKEGDKLHLSGVINQTTQFALLKDFICDQKNVFEFKSVQSVTWQGLVNFWEYIKEFEGEFIFEHIPYNVYRYLRLMPSLRTFVTINSFEVLTLNILDIESSLTAQMFSKRELQSAALSQGPIVSMSEPFQLLGIAEHFCPDYFQTKDTPSPVYRNNWCKLNNDFVTFIYNYLSFASCISGLMVDQVDSIKHGLRQGLSEIKIRVANIEQVLDLFGFNVAEDQYEKVEDLQNSIYRDLARISIGFRHLQSQYDLTLRKLQYSVNDPSVNHPETLQQDISELLSSIDDSEKILLKDNHLWKDFFGQLSGLAVSNRIKVDLLKVIPTGITEETFEKAHELLNTMDPLLESNWKDTKKIILDELELVEKDFSYCHGLIFHSFGLPEMIENRLNERKDLQELIDRALLDESKAYEYCKGFLESIAERLSTEQEQFSLLFYLPISQELEPIAKLTEKVA